jgi:methylenetetrahydrofolate reductase (NADPH)
MHIQDIFEKYQTTFSFEFFPPKTDKGWDALFKNMQALEELEPSFVSVTYGAGGGTREQTHEVVVRLKNETSLDPIPHLTCVCHKYDDIAEILRRYADAGVNNILALGGDPPQWMEEYDKANDDFQHAADLVHYIRKFNDSGEHSDKRGFGIGVAGFPEGHPATPHRLLEMEHLKAKCDAGADYIATQLFFDNHDFYDFRERCELAGIDIPIIAGIMPINSRRMFERLPELAAGSRYPAKLLRPILNNLEDDDAIARVGLDWATQQCRDLLDNGVAGIHFYTLNKSGATKEIYRRLGATNSSELEDLSMY